jgi:hypothetical protein
LLWDDRPWRDFFNSSWKHEKLYYDLDIEKDYVFFSSTWIGGTRADGYDSHGGNGFDERWGGREGTQSHLGLGEGWVVDHAYNYECITRVRMFIGS